MNALDNISAQPVPITEEVLLRFKDVELKKFCKELAIKCSGRKQSKAQRIINHLNAHPTLSWRPPNNDVNAAEVDITTTRDPPQNSWATAGEIAPMPIVPIPISSEGEEVSADNQDDDDDVKVVEELICSKNVPFLGESVVAVKTTVESEEQLQEIYLLMALPFMNDHSLYQASTLSWRMTGIT